MHKFDYAKKCERPACDRFLFPQLHPEAEMIGKAVFYPGTNTKEMCSKMVKRDDNSLFLCKLCILRSQNQYLARKMLDNYKEAAVTKHAEEEAANNVVGITEVNGAIKKKTCGKGLSKKLEQHNVDYETLNHDTSKSNIVANNVIGDVIDDEESDEGYHEHIYSRKTPS